MSLLLLAAILQPVDPYTANNILKDNRLTGYVSLIENTYSVQCPLPAPEALMAEVECFGTGDFASCFYTFSVACSNGQPQDLKIRAERTQLGPILDLNLTANFRS